MNAPKMKQAARLAPEAARVTAQNALNDTPPPTDSQAGSDLTLPPSNIGVVSPAETVGEPSPDRLSTGTDSAPGIVTSDTLPRTRR